MLPTMKSDIILNVKGHSFSDRGFARRCAKVLRPRSETALASIQQIGYKLPFSRETVKNQTSFCISRATFQEKASDNPYHAQQERRMGLPLCSMIRHEQTNLIRLSLPSCHGLVLRDAPESDAVTQGLGVTHRDSFASHNTLRHGLSPYARSSGGRVESDQLRSPVLSPCQPFHSIGG